MTTQHFYGKRRSMNNIIDLVRFVRGLGAVETNDGGIIQLTITASRGWIHDFYCLTVGVNFRRFNVRGVGAVAGCRQTLWDAAYHAEKTAQLRDRLAKM